MTRKAPPVIPVVGQGGDTSREEQLRKWEEQERIRREQQAAAVAPPPQPAVPAPVVPSPAAPVPAAAAEVSLPDPAADPADQLAVCERGIHGAKARWTAKVEGANEEFIAEAGPFLVWVHQHKLYKLMLDNGGKPYRSFAKYLKEQHDLNRRTGYRITQTIPLLNILKAAGHVLPDLSSRQVDALHPVRTQHGDDAVAQVWQAAWSVKKGPLPTPEELEKAKQMLGLATKPEADEDAVELGAAPVDPGAAVVDPGAAVERAAKILVPETVREAARKDPDRIRGLVRVLNAALAEAGEQVD